ncbi:rsmI [Symbiodinium sp. CCMP2456]|nr:rsmI [Symbiodinium sp. CCMP2456]
MATSTGVPQFATLALGVNILFGIRVLCLVFSHRQVIQGKVEETAHAVWTCMRQPRLSSRSTEETARVEAVRQQRLGMAPYYMIACVVVSQFILVAARFSALEHGWLLAGAYWTTLALCLVNLAYLFFPRVLCTSTMDAFYVLHMAFCAIYLSPLCVTPAQTLNASFALLGCIRLPAVLLASRTYLVVVCNLGITVLMFVSTSAPPAGAPSARGQRRRKAHGAFPECDIFDSAYTILCGEVLSFGLAVGMAFLLHGLLHQKVRHEARYKSITTQLGAVSSLLRLTCDALVELDSDLCITENSPQLAAMLLRDRPGSVQGLKFTDLMPTSHEAVRAYEILAGTASGTEVSAVSEDESILANVFHTRLMDSCSSKFRTEVFRVTYRQADGAVHHLLGLRDFTDQGSLAGPKAFDTMDTSHATDSTAEGFPDSVASPTWQEAERDDARSFSDSESGHRTVSSLAASTRSTDDLVVLLIDMAELHVMAASPTVAHLAGVQLGSLFAPKGLHMLMHVFHGASEDTGNNIILFFRRIKIYCGSNQHSRISGRVEVAKTQAGKLHLLLFFRPNRLILRSTSNRVGDETSVGNPQSPTTGTVSLSVLGRSYGRSLHAL